MRNKLKVTMNVILIAIALFLTMGERNATSEISGGKHDMAGAGWGMSNFKFGSAEGVDQTCVFCHTPHHANSNQTYSTNPTLPPATGGGLAGQWLWNRMLPSRTFSVYTNPSTMNASVGQPGSVSLLCLSCHDGVGAMNVLLNYNGQSVALSIDSGTENQFGDFGIGGGKLSSNIGEADCTGGPGDTCTGGLNLQNDHPIGFNYNDTLVIADGGLRSKSAMSSNALKDRLTRFGDRMECSTCHDPHRTNSGGNMFLVIDNTGSALCLECHNK